MLTMKKDHDVGVDICYGNKQFLLHPTNEKEKVPVFSPDGQKWVLQLLNA